MNQLMASLLDFLRALAGQNIPMTLRLPLSMLSEQEQPLKGRSAHELLSFYKFPLQRVKHLPRQEAQMRSEFHRFIRSRQHILAQNPTQLEV